MSFYSFPFSFFSAFYSYTLKPFWPSASVPFLESLCCSFIFFELALVTWFHSCCFLLLTLRSSRFLAKFICIPDVPRYQPIWPAFSARHCATTSHLTRVRYQRCPWFLHFASFPLVPVRPQFYRRRCSGYWCRLTGMTPMISCRVPQWKRPARTWIILLLMLLRLSPVVALVTAACQWKQKQVDPNAGKLKAGTRRKLPQLSATVGRCLGGGRLIGWRNLADLSRRTGNA